MAYSIVKKGDSYIVTECDYNLDGEMVDVGTAPVTLWGDTEQELLELIKDIFDDTRLQQKYFRKQEYYEDYNDYVPDLVDLFK